MLPLGPVLPLLLALALPTPEVVAAADVLHDWDRRRAAAYAVGDPALLRPLYVHGSVTGRADREVLRRYADRGLRVTGLRHQLLAVEVHAHGEHRWRLVVTDRLVGGVARGRGVRVPLPRDRPSTWRIVLRRRDGAWRVGEVRPAQPRRSAASSTWSTSRSAKE